MPGWTCHFGKSADYMVILLFSQQLSMLYLMPLVSRARVAVVDCTQFSKVTDKKGKKGKT